MVHISCITCSRDFPDMYTQVRGPLKQITRIHDTTITYIYRYTHKRIHPTSRHMVVCRAAQEAGTPHREYIYRKKENVIFTPLYLGDPLFDWN